MDWLVRYSRWAKDRQHRWSLITGLLGLLVGTAGALAPTLYRNVLLGLVFLGLVLYLVGRMLDRSRVASS